MPLVLTKEGKLISSSADKTIKIWDIATKQCLATLDGHTGSVLPLALTKDGKLISGADDKTIRIWDLPPKDRSK